MNDTHLPQRPLRARATALAAALTAALALAACGDGRNDTVSSTADSRVAAAPGTSASAATSPYATDRMTADASNAQSRADATIRRDDTYPNDRANTPPSGRDAAASAENAGDRAAAAAGDAALTAKVKAALMAEPGIDSLQIDVDTQGRRVTLSGEVDNAQNRQRALQVARSVDGVGGVVDRLSVQR